MRRYRDWLNLSVDWSRWSDARQSATWEGRVVTSIFCRWWQTLPRCATNSGRSLRDFHPRHRYGIVYLAGGFTSPAVVASVTWRIPRRGFFSVNCSRLITIALARIASGARRRLDCTDRTEKFDSENVRSGWVVIIKLVPTVDAATASENVAVG